MKRRILISMLLGFAPTVYSQTPTSHFIVRGSMELPKAASHDQSRVWNQGAMIVVSDRHSDAPILKVINRSGDEILNTRFTIPGAALINIYPRSITRGADGTMALIGSVYSNDSQGATFLAILSPDAQRQTILRLSPFAAHTVTIGSDGAIWVAGHTWEDGKPADHNQNLIRRYNKSGELLQSLMLWSDINDEPHTPAPDDGSTLAAFGDRVAWFSGTSRTYIEFSLDGKILRRVKTPEFEKNNQVSFAACDDASYLGVTVPATSKRDSSWGIYELARTGEDWKYFAQPNPWGSLHGCDQNHLAARTDTNRVVWLGKNDQ
jgi:hypothetical protein